MRKWLDKVFTELGMGWWSFFYRTREQALLFALVEELNEDELVKLEQATHPMLRRILLKVYSTKYNHKELLEILLKK